MTADTNLPGLAACPFCGGSQLESGGDDKFVGVRCLNCEASGPNQYRTGCDWNTRAASAPDGVVAYMLPTVGGGHAFIAASTDYKYKNGIPLYAAPQSFTSGHVAGQENSLATLDDLDHDYRIVQESPGGVITSSELIKRAGADLSKPFERGPFPPEMRMLPPETLVVCEHCGGEGSIDKAIHVYEHGCGVSHPDIHSAPCQSCGGSGGSIQEVPPDAPMGSFEWYQGPGRRIASDPSPAPVGDVREGLVAAIRAAKLALFTIRKQGVMPNSSWETGFNSDVAKAEAALAALTAGEKAAAVADGAVQAIVDDMLAAWVGKKWHKAFREDLARLVTAAQSTTLATPRDRLAVADQIIDQVDASAAYLVWSNEHSAWWGPAHRGYNTHISHAGRYTRDEAIKICVGARGGREFNQNPSEVPILLKDAEAFWTEAGLQERYQREAVEREQEEGRAALQALGDSHE